MKEELKAFKKFKETYQFEPKEIIEKDGIQYCDGIALIPLYRNVLKKCDKPIIHSLGNENEQETVFTRYEFEKQLNCLKDFLKDNSTEMECTPISYS